jgi:hypothetical protein
VLARPVHDLLSLFGRQATPDVPRCQNYTDGPETSAEARHETILAQALLFAPFVLVLVVALALVMAVVFRGLGLW